MGEFCSKKERESDEMESELREEDWTDDDEPDSRKVVSEFF